MSAFYLGIDVGSVSTDLVVMDEKEKICARCYRRSEGRPAESVAKGLEELFGTEEPRLSGIGVTGSGRRLIGALLHADAVKNEITAHALAAVKVCPDVRTVLEIGGQDSKLILLRQGIVTDFAMNSVCAAGTGSFLDRQAQRMGIRVEEIGAYAARAERPTPIAGRCAVFAESDMIHRQQQGDTPENILRGLCQALVRNYLANLARGKELAAPILFQGGVAANQGIVQAFEEALGQKVRVPESFDVMGAWGAALLARSAVGDAAQSRRLEAQRLREPCEVVTFLCEDCSNHCEIRQLRQREQSIGSWGSRCGKYS